MKGKLDSAGNLCIERSGGMTRVHCINNKDYACNHECSHFGEPEYHKLAEKDGGMWWVTLCHKSLYFYDGDFVDERSSEEEK